MTELLDWLVNLPRHFAQFGEWLTTPIAIGDLSISPLAMLGSSAVAFVGVLVVLKIKNLIW